MKKLLFILLLFVSGFVSAQELIGDTLILYKGADIGGQTDLNGNKIVNLLNPTNDQDAATKKYVDDNTLSGDNPFIDFEVNTNDPIYKQARLWYDSINSELAFYDAVVDVKFGVVSELSFKIINTTGSTLSVGDIVYPTGVSSGFTTVALARADQYETSRPVGMIKTETLNGQIGWVTIKGKVEGVNTSTLSGGIFYLSPTTAGGITQVRPTGGNFIIRVGAVKEVGVNGSVEIDVFTNEYTAESISPRGWSDEAISNTILAPTSGTRTFQVLGTSYIYEDGIKYDISNESVVWDDIEGTVDFYLDQGVLTAANNLTEAQVRDIYSAKPGVARMYWDATNDTIIYVNDMRHTFDMNGNTWATFWDTDGCIVLDGLALTDIIADANGSLDSHAQFGHQSGVIRNQDIITDVPLVTSTGGYTVFYRTGTTAWRSVDATPFPVITTGTGRLAWNEDVGGTWQLSEVANNDFVLCHLFAANTLGDKTGTVVGQAEYTSLTSARDGAKREINALLFGQFPIKELTPIATLIYQTSNAYGNTVQARIRSSEDQFGDLVDYIDWRDQRALAGSVGGAGASSFLDLNDTPATYTGESNQAAVVNGTEDGLSFIPVVLSINSTPPVASNYNIVLSNNKVGENVEIIPGGTGTSTTFSVADNDNDITNELQDLGNSKLNNDVTITISNGTNTTVSDIARTDFANTFSLPQTISSSSATPLNLSRSSASNVSVMFATTSNTKYLGLGADDALRIGDSADLAGTGDEIYHSGNANNNSTPWNAQSFSVVGTTVIDASRNIVNAGGGSFGGTVTSTGGSTYSQFQARTNTASNSTQRIGLTGRPYANSTADVGIANLFADATSNIVLIGGGAGVLEAATSVDIYTASSVGTLTGTRRLRINSSGIDVTGDIDNTGDITSQGEIISQNVFKVANQTLTASANTNYNCSTSVNASITLTQNTGITFINLVDGMSGNFVVTQDGVGGRTLTILSPTPKVINGGSGVITLTGTPNSVDIISWYYNGTTLYITYGLNYN